jgi:hypothetical protein
LVKFFDGGQKSRISNKALEIEYAKHQLKYKTVVYNRAMKLAKNKAIPLAELDAATDGYHNARVALKRYELEHKKLVSDHGDYILPAQFDCKVTSVLRTEYSGVGLGDEVLMVQEINLKS